MVLSTIFLAFGYNFIMRFPQILKELRESKSLLQYELAKEIHYSKSIIGAWERAESLPTADALIALAKFFNVSIEYLLGLETEWGTPVSSEAPQLTPDEQKIIALYRTMDKELQENALSTMELFARSANSSQKKFK